MYHDFHKNIVFENYQCFLSSKSAY